MKEKQPDSWRIRPYRESDEAAVVQLWEKVFPDEPPWNVPAKDIGRKLQVQRDLFLVGELDGRVIASVMAGYDGLRGWIHRLAVQPQHRRCGFGGALMNEAEQRLQNLGCPKVNLQVRSGNGEATAFYQKLDYLIEDRISMGKLLAEPPAPSNDEPPSAKKIRLDVNEHIHLTEVRPADKPAFVEHLNDQDIAENSLRIPYPYTEKDADSFLAIVAQTVAAHGHPLHFAVRDHHEKLIGGCGFEGLSYGHRAEIGYWLAKRFWGRGWMTEVVGRLCRYAQDQWKLVRIIAQVFDFNTASARVLEKNGFLLEGTQRKVFKKKDRYLDANLYALVR